MNKIDRLGLKGLVLTTEADWEKITISSADEQEGIRLGTLQENESAKLGLRDRSFHGSAKESLERSIAAKQFEFAVKQWGGGTARVVQVNEFHDYPDVGQVNCRFTFTHGYGLVITQRDQGKVPIILGTGKSPDFQLIGWFIPDYAKYFISKVHANPPRTEDCESSFGFLQEMKDHEACHLAAQLLLPMKYLSKDLVK